MHRFEHNASIYFDMNLKYPCKPPYNPTHIYPEYPLRNESVDIKNNVYPAIREMFHILKMDNENYDTARWNPLKEIIFPGDKVLLKPNFVLDVHPLGDEYLVCLVTHGSIIRAILDYACMALDGQGEIVIADVPLHTADFNNLMYKTKLPEVIKHVKKTFGIPIEVIDLRDQRDILDEYGSIVREIKLAGDPLGYTVVDLGKNSEFHDISTLYKQYRVTTFDQKEMSEHHNLKVNEYYIPKTVLSADVVINLPKLKTHKKAGITLSLKNMIGINTKKNWLPHHRAGDPTQGGDEFPEASFQERFRIRTLEYLRKMPIMKKTVVSSYLGLKRLFPERPNFHNASSGNGSKIREGSWYGNDTIWRTILDMNKILFYADKQGKMQNTKQRQYFSVVDGVVAGEGEGPLISTPKQCGVLIGGFDPVKTDVVCSWLMGFDYKKIPQLIRAFGLEKYPLTDAAVESIRAISNNPQWNGYLNSEWEHLDFAPSRGWKGHIERYSILY